MAQEEPYLNLAKPPIIEHAANICQENLRPTCGPENMELCDVLSQKQLKELFCSSCLGFSGRDRLVRD